MIMTEWMDVFRLLYTEGLKPLSIAAALNREPSSIACGLEKGTGRETLSQGNAASPRYR
jgi:hypothetical protein